MAELRGLIVTDEFLQSYGDKRFTASDKAAVLKALGLLSGNSRHPSLRLHALQGDLRPWWSMSATNSLRVLVMPVDDKYVVGPVSKHYR